MRLFGACSGLHGGGAGGKPQAENLKEAVAHWVRCQQASEWDEDEVEELRAWGFSEEEIDEIVGQQKIEPFGVWPENEPTVRVFELCAWDKSIGPMGGVCYWGINGREILSVCHLRRVPPAERDQVLQGVRLMGIHGSNLLNQAIRKKEEELTALERARSRRK